MAAIYEKSVTSKTSEKALQLLEKVGNYAPIRGNVYAYILTITGGADDGLTIDAILNVTDRNIEVLTIWEMDYNAIKGMYAARNEVGETGDYAIELARKYMTAFLTVLENADIDSLTPPIRITHDLVQKIENEIDATVNPSLIDAAEIQKYNRVEMIESALSVLRENSENIDKELKLGECIAAYDWDASIFEILFPEQGIKLRIPLITVVERKWAEDCNFVKSLCMCVVESVLEQSA